MPIYEFKCRACERSFEQFVRPAPAEPPASLNCPYCQSTDLERLLSMFAVSSDATHEAHLRQARKVGMKQHVDKQRAEAEVMARIEAEHDH